MTFRTTARATLATAAVIVCGAAAVYGYSTYARWGSSSVVFYVNPQNTDMSMEAAEAALQAGASAWSSQSRASIALSYGGRVNDTTTAYDGRNVVIFRNATSGSALASTYSWWSGGTLTDSDIVVWDAAATFFGGSSGCGGYNGAYLEDIAAHEFGHLLGLNHSSVADATMYAGYGYCSQSYRTLAADDITGIEALYPPTSQPKNSAPVVSITAPASGSSFVQGTATAFSGWASDTEDGTLTSSLTWTSSIDGSIGNGGSFSRVLSAGTHTITATVRDSGGLAASRSITVAIAQPTYTGPAASAAFVGTDLSTAGSWKGVYGRDGHSLAGSSSSLPAYALVQYALPQWTWAASTGDARALQKVSGTDRIAAAWYGATTTVQVSLTDGVTHQLALYLLDWDSAGRRQTVEIFDTATNAVLDTRTVTGFTNGQYLVWNLTGRTTIRITGLSGPNAVHSALFFDPIGSPPAPAVSSPSAGTSAAATFVGTDTTTRGNWKGTYGNAGYALAGDGSSMPGFASIQQQGTAAWTWVPSTTDSRALQKAAALDRVAAAWYGSAFDVNLALTDGLPHRLAVYVVDWDGAGRTQSIQVLDASSGTVLDSRTASGFSGGQYFVWNLTGRVTLRFRGVSGPNAVYSALFFDPATSSAGAAATFVGTDTNTRGDWKGIFGTGGYMLAGDGISLPSYAVVQQQSSSAWTWAASTADGRALRKVALPDRIAAAWYAASGDIQLNLVDGLTHQVALYLLDWDGGGRVQSVQVLDAATGAVLDTRTASDFTFGHYLIWNMRGRVTIRVARVSGVNAVYSAIFFDR
jgi:uncharacterized membrane protein YkoI